MSPSEAGRVRALARRPRWTEEEGRVVVEAAASSGGSLRSFATRYGIDPFRLYRWRRKIRRAGGVERVEFAEIAIAHQAGTPVAGDGFMEIVAPSGWVVRLGRAFDSDALGRVLAVLRASDAC